MGGLEKMGKEALEILKYSRYRNKIEEKDILSIEILEELVDRDAPKKVVKEVDKKYVDTYEFYERDIYRCGSCKKVLIIDRHRKQDNEKN